MKISEHVSYKEAVKSNTALRLGIDNTPDDGQLYNMQKCAQSLFEPLRSWVGGPIKINSFFRCEELNKAIGGSSKSQHVLGLAIDIDDTFGHKTNAEMFNFIKDRLSFDQLIWEFGDDDNPDWVHMSFVNTTENRHKVLRAYREDGKTKYKVV